MPKIDDWGFCGPSYLEITGIFDCQRSINLFPVPGGSHSKSKMALIGRPGFSPNALATTLASPCRALWAGNNRMFSMGGSHAYEVSAIGGIVTDWTLTGSAGSGDGYMVANGVQLLAQDTSNNGIYNLTGGGGATAITFNGSALEYLDGFYVAIATGASLAGVNPNQVNVSALNDGSTWSALNFVIRTGSADLTTQLAVLNGQLWIFGQKTIEIWYNAGNPLFPFARIQGATINQGLLAAATVTKFSNTIMWLGIDAQGYAIVYMAQGTSPVRVSNYAIEQYLSSLGTLELSQAVGMSYQEGGHTFYILGNLGVSGNQSIVYDLTAGLWHERTYAFGYPTAYTSLPTFNPAGAVYVGDQNGKIWFQSTAWASDGGTNAITYTRTAPHVSDHNAWIKYPRLEIDADAGTAPIALGISDDGGQNFRTRTAIAASGGATVDGFKTFAWTQMGRSMDRVYKAAITSSSQLVRLIDARLWANKGTGRGLG